MSAPNPASVRGARGGVEPLQVIVTVLWPVGLDPQDLVDAIPSHLAEAPVVSIDREDVCREYECTDCYACEGGCAWVESDLCTACAPAAPSEEHCLPPLCNRAKGHDGMHIGGTT